MAAAALAGLNTSLHHSLEAKPGLSRRGRFCVRGSDVSGATKRSKNHGLPLLKGRFPRVGVFMFVLNWPLE